MQKTNREFEVGRKQLEKKSELVKTNKDNREKQLEEEKRELCENSQTSQEADNHLCRSKERDN